MDDYHKKSALYNHAIPVGLDDPLLIEVHVTW
jgi:hypothetical protein